MSDTTTAPTTLEFYIRKPFDKTGPIVRDVRTFPTTRNTYAYDFDKKTGRKVLVKTGETNFYELIQSSKDDNSVRGIVDRMNRGDMTALGQAVEGFIDGLAFPKNFMEMQNVNIQMQNMFAALSPDEKKEYGSDINVFIKSMNEKLDKRLEEAAEKHREQLKQQAQQPAQATQQPTQEVTPNADK